MRHWGTLWPLQCRKPVASQDFITNGAAPIHDTKNWIFKTNCTVNWLTLTNCHRPAWAPLPTTEMTNPTSLYSMLLNTSSHIWGSCVWCLDQTQQLIQPNPALLEKCHCRFQSLPQLFCQQIFMTHRDTGSL